MDDIYISLWNIVVEYENNIGIYTSFYKILQKYDINPSDDLLSKILDNYDIFNSFDISLLTNATHLINNTNINIPTEYFIRANSSICKPFKQFKKYFNDNDNYSDYSDDESVKTDKSVVNIKLLYNDYVYFRELFITSLINKYNSKFKKIVKKPKKLEKKYSKKLVKTKQKKIDEIIDLFNKNVSFVSDPIDEIGKQMESLTIKKGRFLFSKKKKYH